MVEVPFPSQYLKFYHFYKEAFGVIEPGTPFVENWHIAYLCDRLQQETFRIHTGGKVEKDLIINVPFRTGKSYVTTVAWNAWSWIIEPSMSFLTVSYSSSLSTTHSRKTKNLIQSDWYQERFGHIYQLAGDQKAKTKFENDKGGSRFATSMTGSGTGEGGDVILIDDALNPKEAASDKERERANTNYDETFYSRTKNPNTAVRVIIGQRLHENDLTGHLLEQSPNQHEHIKLPATSEAEIKPAKLEKYYKKGLLWPERFSVEQLEKYKRALGSYAYAGQLQQEPAPLTGGIWKQWFRIVEKINQDNLQSIGVDWDLAYTEKESNSASAYVVSGRRDSDIFILDCGAVYKEFPELINFMKSFDLPHYVEGKASGKSAVQSLRREGLNAIEVDGVAKDKVSRTLEVVPVAEAGRIYTTQIVADNLYFMQGQGILKFPNNTHDDLNDALTQAIKRNSKGEQLYFV